MIEDNSIPMILPMYGIRIFRSEPTGCDRCKNEQMPRLDNSVVLCQSHIDELLAQMDKYNQRHIEEEMRRNSIANTIRQRPGNDYRGAFIRPRDELLDYANLCINWPDELPSNFRM